MSLDEEIVIGKISKKWAGFIRELSTNADKFGIQFPFDLDVKIKALMLGASFLIVSLFLFCLAKREFSEITIAPLLIFFLKSFRSTANCAFGV